MLHFYPICSQFFIGAKLTLKRIKSMTFAPNEKILVYLCEEGVVLDICHELYQSLKQVSQLLFKFGLALVTNRSRMQLITLNKEISLTSWEMEIEKLFLDDHLNHTTLP